MTGSRSWDVLSRLDTQVSDRVIALATAFDGEAVVPRPSASVVLVRDGGDGIETYVLHRHAQMAFAPGMAVFPGGRLDLVDKQAAEPIRACAIRETREETGLTLTAGQLYPWAHWITPEFEPIRYDTTFYVAVAPADQEAADLSGETVSADWMGVAEAVRAQRHGKLALMPPTLSIMLELADSTQTAQLVERAAEREIRTVQPRLVGEAGHWRFSYADVSRKGEHD